MSGLIERASDDDTQGKKRIVQAGYNAIAAQYLRFRNTDSADVKLLDDLMCRLPKGAKVLDAGCGAGVPIARLLAERFDVTGVDFAEAQIQLARQFVPKAQFEVQDITRSDSPDGALDAVVSYYAIIHIPREEHRGTLQNFFRMLKPAGLALMCLGADDLPNDIDEDYLGARMYWSHYDAATNLKMVEECGFAIVWSKLIADETSPGSAHLFVLAQKPDAEGVRT